jgi:hypothetical protein
MDENEPDNPYLHALTRAWAELFSLQEDEKRLTLKKAQLKNTIDALFPLAFPEAASGPDIANMSLANAIRLVVQSSGGRAVTVKEVRGKLQDLGFDLAKYENPLASIHTAARRMVESEELTWVDDEGKKLQAGPEMKNIPDSTPSEERLNELLGTPRSDK